MGLNPRSRGRGRGGKSFPNKGRRVGGIANQGPMIRPGPPSMFCPPPMGFPSEPPFGGPFYGIPSGFNYGPPRHGFGKFFRKNFKRKVSQKSNEAPVLEIDLKKPWVTEEIKNEDSKKQECLETWRKSKSDEDWSKYKSQKLIVQTLYDKAKDEYIANHPEEAEIWQYVVSARNYYCETCDKSFRTDDDLIYHEAEHETCGREGCEFTAHPKIITRHIKMQHDSGLYKRMGKLYTEEEISKWLEERKKRYPSRQKIEEKKSLEKEQFDRGERIKDNTSKFNKAFQNKNSKNKSFKKKIRPPKNRRSKKKKKNQEVQFYFEEESPPSIRSIPAFTGIRSACQTEEFLKKEEILHITDDEWDAENKTQCLTKPLLNNSLGMLAANYNSDVENFSDEENLEKQFQKENKTEEISGDEENVPQEIKSNRSINGLVEECVENNKDFNKRKFDRKKDNLGENKKRKKCLPKNFAEPRNLTLLEKLLKKEIRHERNIILQCVHYVVKNNFFES